MTSYLGSGRGEAGVWEWLLSDDNFAASPESFGVSLISLISVFSSSPLSDEGMSLADPLAELDEAAVDKDDNSFTSDFSAFTVNQKQHRCSRHGLFCCCFYLFVVVGNRLFYFLKKHKEK